MCCNNLSRCGCYSEGCANTASNAGALRNVSDTAYALIPIDANALLAAEEAQNEQSTWDSRYNNCNFSNGWCGNFQNGCGCRCGCGCRRNRCCCR